jgi:LacI family transcriptional regulator
VVTRDDVARLAKTSTAVVSYVMNDGPRRVSDATRHRVLDAIEGWAKALREARIDANPQLLVRSEFDRHQAYDAAREMFRARNRPTALFVHSDEQAIGILHAAAASDVDISGDLAVVSFDGVRESRLTHPALTTVQQPVEAAGQRAVELVTDGSGGSGGTASDSSETMPVTLVIRESCGCTTKSTEPMSN